MTKKMLQGIAAGIMLTTLIFAYNFYFTNNFTIIKDQPDNVIGEVSEEDIEQYLKSHNLVAVDKLEYEELLNMNEVEKEEVEKNDEDGRQEEVVEDESIKEVLFVVEPGTSSGAVGIMLEEEGLIDDRQQFENYLSDAGLETQIRAGEYYLSTGMSLEEIIENLT